MGKLQTLFYTMGSRSRLKRKRVHLSPLATIDAQCSFGENIYIDRFCNLHATTVGDYSLLGWSTFTDQCEIGKYCSIAPNVSIGVPSHPLSRLSTSSVFYSPNNTGKCLIRDSSVTENLLTCIGNDVWIGTYAVIMGGVTVGNGAVIAAGAIVTKDVPPYAIVGGVPSKIIRYRFSPRTIEILEKSAWWSWPTEKLMHYAQYIGDGEAFAEALAIE